jgi:predicted phosphate transport protein (TIGR00153 family)
MFNFMPREEDFFSLFQQSSKNVIEGGRLLKELMEDFQDIPEKVQLIKDVEHQGDEITHDIVKRLNQTFITPLDREDIHDLTTALDDILDEIDAVADLFFIYKIPKPTEAAVKLADILYQASVEVGKGVKQLAHGGLDVDQFSIHVNSLENEADRLSRNAISTLFDEEKDPIMVLKWKEIYESFETGADCCEDAANVLERIALKAT